ncbi:FAD-dependent oxidoreductase [Streptomyces orinoci]|uniref:FAD-dependent monooxygenase n=1 Tax=Streptomyces orinoci TaxID=67339 RepID=A0ABV3K0L7_STRON|nr:FAD-dependent monooxygenase [Streptomyces orinoci]
MNARRTALVIGGGIAGPVTAMALQQAGIDATIYEAYEQSAGLSHGIYLTIAVNGIAALKAIGADQALTAHGFPTGEIEFASGTGKHLATVPNGMALPDGTVTRTVLRSDVYAAITAEAARRGIHTLHGKRLTDATATPSGGVLARFADGTTAEADLLVGADGVHSATRTIIDPSAPGPRYTGLGNTGGFARVDGLEGKSGTYHMVFGKRCFFGYAIAPDGQVWWFGNPPRKAEISREELRTTTPEQWRAMMLDLYRDDKSPAARIVAASEPFRVFNQYDLPTVPVWHRGPMVLVGDAAHAVAPSSGQGVSMACEDAVVLAKCLRDLPTAERAFAIYERLRRARVERVVAYGERGSGSKQVGPVGRAIRDAILPVVMKRMARPEAMSAVSWLFDHRIDWDAPVATAA